MCLYIVTNIGCVYEEGKTRTGKENVEGKGRKWKGRDFCTEQKACAAVLKRRSRHSRPSQNRWWFRVAETTTLPVTRYTRIVTYIHYYMYTYVLLILVLNFCFRLFWNESKRGRHNCVINRLQQFIIVCLGLRLWRIISAKIRRGGKHLAIMTKPKTLLLSYMNRK